MSNLSLKLIIDGTATGALRALNEVKTGTSAVESQLKRLQDVGRNALQFLGIGLGIRELISLADTYTQMTSRLKLVTQYTGDFQQTFNGLADSARATRSDLGATVDLYTRIAPSLQGIGLVGKPAVGIITTINQAIAISGASAQSASAALVQLAQGLGAGALRGDEFNSVMENTPGLAQAIADGIGVPIGALRKMAEEGKLTAEVIAAAMQKVAPQIEADFAKMPKTVSQALTGLKNEVLLYVGATDKAVGGTSVLANVIGEVAKEFQDAGPVVTAFTGIVKIMVNGLDGAYRMIKIVGLGIAGYAAAAKTALSGDFSGARAIWKELGKDIEDVLLKPLLTAPKADEVVADSARKRQLLEEQLKTQVEKLEAQKLYIATGAMDKIAGKEKETIDKRIAEQQRLVDAVRAAWQASLKDAEQAAEQAAGLLDKARQKRARTADKVTNAQIKDLSPEDQAAVATTQAQDLFDQGRYAAAASNAARLDKRFKDAEKYQKQAEDFFQRAESFADKAGNIDLIESIGNAQADLLTGQATALQAKAEGFKQQAADQAKLLNELQAQLEKMQADARSIEVKVDVSAAESAIKGFKAQLDAIPESKTTTITVNTVNGNTAAPVTLDAPVAMPQFAYGGMLPGSAPHDRADNRLYWGTPGEWVIQRPATRYYGAAFMAAINAMKLPKYAFGGQIGGSAIERLRIPALASPAASGSNRMAPANFYLDGQRYPVQADPDVIGRLAAHFGREALRKGGRR